MEVHVPGLRNTAGKYIQTSISGVMKAAMRPPEEAGCLNNDK